MPAYNAGRTLRRTYDDLPHDIVDEVIVVDDASHDDTVAVARELGLTVVLHERNEGYGANQKTCYAAALERGADIVVMVHPDYQYSPKLCGPIAWMVASGEYDVVLASRILGNSALDGGMPLWRYLANRALTAFENVMLGAKLSEYHTGYRAYSREVLERLPLLENSDDFVFDNQVIAQVIRLGFRIGEISCPTRYDGESSSINFRRSCVYGMGVLATSIAYRLSVLGVVENPIFDPTGRRLEPGGVAERKAVDPEAGASVRADGAFDRLPSALLPVLVFLASLVAQFARRPDLFLRPQFFAEDGLFYAQAHNLGAFAELWTESNGYLQLLPRMVAAFAQAVPLAWAPVVMLVAGACVNALPAAFVVSRRMRTAVPSVLAQLLLAALFMAMPGVKHVATILTYSQWYLSLVALMIVIAEPPRTRAGTAADFAVLVVSGLSGPYSILLAPVAIVHWWLRSSARAFRVAALFVTTGAVQLVTILTIGLAARSGAPRGASVFQFLRVVGGRVVYGATAGHTLQATVLPLWGRSLGAGWFIAAAGAAGLALLAVAFWRGTHELRMLLMFGGAIIAAVLVNASVPVNDSPQWVVLGNQDVLGTYFVVPIMCVYAASVWMVSQRARAWRVAGAAVLGLALVFAIPRDFREEPVDDADFQTSVRAYEAAPAGATVHVPIAPLPWSIELVKPASGR